MLFINTISVQQIDMEQVKTYKHKQLVNVGLYNTSQIK